MVYTVFYKTSSFAGYCFLGKNSIHPKRYDVFSFKAFIAILVKIQICSFIVINKYNSFVKANQALTTEINFLKSHKSETVQAGSPALF